MAKTKDFTVRISQSVYDRLRQKADDQFTSVAAVVRQILAEGAKG